MSHISIAGDRGGDPVGADRPNFADGVISEISDENVGVWVDGEAKGELKRASPLVPLANPKLVPRPAIVVVTQFVPIWASLRTVSCGVANIKISTAIHSNASWQRNGHRCLCRRHSP